MFAFNFWLYFLSVRLILIVLEEKVEPHILCICEIIDGEGHAHLNV